MQVLHDLGAEMRQDPYFRRLILEPLEVAGVDRFTDSAVVIKARFKTRPLRQWDVRGNSIGASRIASTSWRSRSRSAPRPRISAPTRRAARRLRTSKRIMPSPRTRSRRARRSQLRPGLIGHGRAVADAAGRRCPQRPPAGLAAALSSFALLLAGCTEEPARRYGASRGRDDAGGRRAVVRSALPAHDRRGRGRWLARFAERGVRDPATDRSAAAQPDQVAAARRG